MRILISHFFSKTLAIATCLAALIPSDAVANQEPQFSDFYELEPFEVTGEEIPITIFARNGGDRAYGTRFAHQVVEMAYQTLERSPGSGLLIVGKLGETHPITLFERFKERSLAEDASPELKAISSKIEEDFGKWQENIDINLTGAKASGAETEIDLDPQALVNAFPIPLPATAAQLYVLAWERRFDPEQFEKLLSQIKAEDLESDAFEEFTWVFYLPPRKSVNVIIKEALPAVFEAENLGFFKRSFARAAVATFKPMIKDFVEAVRKGVLYWSVLHANREAFNEGDIQELAKAYIRSQMPRGKLLGGGKSDRALEFIERQKTKNAEYAKDPFIAPIPLDAFDIASFAPYEGTYRKPDHNAKKLYIEDGSLFLKQGEKEPELMLPAGPNFLVSKNQSKTLRLIPGETPSFNQIEIRAKRYRHSFTRIAEIEVE